MNVTPVKKLAIVQAYHLTTNLIGPTEILRKLVQQYNPVDHVVGVKSVALNLKDSHTGTVQYPREGLVSCSDFRKDTSCGGGLHFSLAHSRSSMASTLVTKEELRAKFQLALLPTDKTMLVGGDKFKAPVALIVHTGTFAEIYDSLKLVFPDLALARAGQIVSQPR